MRLRGASLLASGVMALAVSGGGAAATNASVTLRVSASRDAFRIPSKDDRLLFRLHMSTGAKPERFSVAVKLPRFPGEGATLDPVALSLRGAGRLARRVDSQGVPACSPTLGRFHGVEPVTQVVDVHLPRRARGTLVNTVRIAQTPPWPTTRYAPTYVVRPRLIDGTPGTLRRTRYVRAREPSPEGISGVRIVLRTTPRAPRAHEGGEAVVHTGEAIDISGYTQPPLSGQRVTLAYLGPSNPTDLRAIADLTLDARSRFALSGWQPPEPGRYELWALYESQRAGLASDHACPLRLRVSDDLRGTTEHSPERGAPPPLAPTTLRKVDGEWRVDGGTG